MGGNTIETEPGTAEDSGSWNSNTDSWTGHDKNAVEK